ncbi:hypothetical protein PHYBLDRAFT_72886 [Phycomyces blakesleeanus NRRL 1555(-)]|uniref:Uncharacterized protein n=1 Tax=Phycomyces blakesleeanus (strain ATCC 8743b / DSM 1359 / FGSC 10004 / NBRC 33097 / NRRL 1555) TaxID=763407 RepID=A0A162PZ99_PHYB8|nr:hypothetical protein PHYBLDRAFT_72886 [Phycomyces blakesleeanus NRRL 1555(-)]OAD75696.1 hypothetical protein PHYBLDRAFT_72886 [Phycomyces blakesleeanus NRRL 1555(-)]|eukprot:XP_018293736.1 hypothetical protein PHYBLDRAFT_72886 [Phycomyces blakesleeanus NRRL 1555(-)]
MFDIANPNEVCYKCTRCNRNSLRYTMTNKRTAKCHTQNDNDRKINKTINVLTAEVNTSEADMDIDQIEEHIEYNNDNYSVGAPLPEQYVNTHLPLLYTSESESEYELSDEFEQEEQSREQEQESTENLPENIWHQVIAVFTVIFISSFIVDEGAVILITFINTILEHYRENFRLPTSIPDLRKMTGYNDLIKGISKYVACSNCHTLYNYSNNTYTFCNFKRVGSKTYYKNDLYKSSMKNTIVVSNIIVDLN